MTTSQLTQENSRFLDQSRAFLRPTNEAFVTNSAHAALIPPPSYNKKPHIEHLLKRYLDSGLSGASYIEPYLYDQQRRNCRPNTIRSNFTAIFLFMTYLKSLGREEIETVTRHDIGGFIEHLQDRGLRPSTVHGRTKSLYAFLNYLAEQDIVHPDIMKKKFLPKLPDALPRAIDPEDISRFLSVIHKVRDRAMMLTLLRTGMRIGELLSTKVIDVNLEEQRIEIFEASKNRVGRVVYLSEDACEALTAWLRKKDPQQLFLFYGWKNQPLCYTAARMRFCKYMEAADLSHKGYTLHCLRHTFASELLNAGMRLECLQQLLGHSNIEMTRRYARLTDNTRKEEYFKAMAIIEKGGIHGHYRLDHPLSQVPEKEKLL